MSSFPNGILIRELDRKDYLFKKGQSDRSIYFVESGTIRIYYPGENEDITIGFGYEGTLFW